ncbi:MAG TPA: hypothetical protein VFY40_01150 [Blastocatellia bacterium]|nr:hypothetical protein [Blastocatellia bacterium]
MAIGGIILAASFVVIAIVRPGALDWFLRPGDERSATIKEEMERRKGGDTSAKQEEKATSASITPTPSPTSTEEAPPAAEDGNAVGYERISGPDCISRDQVARIIGASEEAREGRVIEIRVAPDRGEIIVAYQKKTFLGIGSGENQIEGILRRGLRNRFSNRLIKSVKVRSVGTRKFQQGERNVKVEVLEIETQQAGCRWP